MRERRVFMLLGIVLAVFVLGLAYAAVSTQLEITGNATGNFDPANFQVKFSKVSAVTGTNGVNTSGSTASINTDPTKGTFNFTGFTTKGQTQSATWTISNENQAELYAHIEMNTDTEINKEHFRATCELADDVIAPNETTTVTVTVECIKTPEGNVDSGTMTFGFTATSSHTGKQEMMTFTVDGTEYQIEAGSTWADVVEKYPTLSVDNKENVYYRGSILIYGDAWVKVSDDVIEGYHYQMSTDPPIL